jgi:hypothetical protein
MESGTLFRENMHPSKNVGVVFTIVLLIVTMITNVSFRGLSSAIVIILILFFTVLFAWLGWWQWIMDKIFRLSIHMNAGFYFFLSTVLLIAWVLITFGYDRMSYWRVTPGQITHEFIFGGGQKSYDTEGMVFEKLRDDLFRHWVLGFGSGDMIMYPMTRAGAAREELEIHNVLLIGTQLRKIQEMIAAKPEEPGQ